jgi:hypothetical protein
MDETTPTSPGGQPRKASRDDLAAMIAGIAETQIEQSKILHAILGLLSAVATKDGDELSELLKAMIARLGEQTTVLARISAELAKLGRDLPLDLVAAIDDHLDLPRRGNGRAD